MYTFSVQAAGVTNSVEGTLEAVNEVENGYDIKMKDDKRFFNISNAGAMKEEHLVLLKESFKNKTKVRLKLRDREVIGVETVSDIKTIKPTVAGKVATLGKPVVGGRAPDFVAKTHDGKDFKLADRTGQWTVLYFYPKAETPGCTKQACAFRDSIKVIRALNADVFGISADTVKEQAAFHKNHNLTFKLIADPDAKVIEQYGVKMIAMKMAKRWTFILSPDLVIAKIFEGVDPVKDAGNVAAALKELQKSY